MEHRFSRWTCVTLLAGCFWASAAAGQAPPAEPEQSLEEIVTTAARIPETLLRTAADVTIITRQDLERRQITTVADALRTVPALNVVQSGTPGSVTSVFARGGNSNHTLVLIDGVRVNSPTNGVFDFANLTTDGVERIEVVRGPTSALYGSDGLTAVINIISKKGEGKPNVTVRADAGSYQTFREQARSSGAVGLLGYSVDLSRTDSSGKFAHDEMNNTAGAVRLDAKVDPTLSVDLTARYTHAFKNLPGVRGRTDFFTGLPDPTQSTREDQTNVTLGATHNPTSWYDHRIQLSYVGDDVDFRDPLEPLSTADTTTSRFAADWQHNFRPISWDALSVGLQLEQSSGESRDQFGGKLFSENITNLAFYGQNQATLWDRLILGVGARVDDNSAFGSHVSPKFSSAFLIKETGSKLRASYGEGFRAPTLNDLFFPGFSNPDLKPEENRSLEFGIDQSLWRDRIQAKLTWFQSRFRNLIQALAPTFKPTNVAHARTQGLEASLALRPGYGLDVVGNYTYLDSRDDAGQQLLRRPQNTWNVTANYAVTTRVNVNSTLLYVGRRVDIDPVTFGRAENTKYVKWDAGASVVVVNEVWKLRKLTAYAKLDNILGVHYEEALGFPTLGRAYLLGVSGEF